MCACVCACTLLHIPGPIHKRAFVLFFFHTVQNGMTICKAERVNSRFAKTKTKKKAKKQKQKIKQKSEKKRKNRILPLEMVNCLKERKLCCIKNQRSGHKIEYK